MSVNTASCMQATLIRLVWRLRQSGDVSCVISVGSGTCHSRLKVCAGSI